MSRGFLVASLVGLLSITMAGCDSDQPENIADGVDQSAVADYDALIAADEAAMTDADAEGGASE